MRIELTIAWGDRACDVRVEAPDEVALGAVLPELAAAVGAPPDAPAWMGANCLAATTPLADRRLRSGARLRFGGADPVACGTSVLALHVAGGPAAGRVLPLERGKVTIGRAADNDLVLADADVSRRHAVLTVTATDITIRDVGSTNGTVLAGTAVPSEGARLQVGDVVRVGASLLTVAGPLGPPAAIRPGPDGSLLLDRVPRPREPVADRMINLPGGASPQRPHRVQWLTALLPAVAGGAIAWLFGQPEFLLFALLSPAMVVSSALGDRLRWRRARRRGGAELRRQRADADRAITRGLLAETAVRRRAAPDPAAVLRALSLPDARVWARQRGDPDLLRVRVGVADLPSTLAVRDAASVAPAGTVFDVPLCIDLRRGPMGLTGPAEPVRASARWLVAQLAAQAAPADVEFALFLAPGCAPAWRWTRWLPHLGGRVAFGADDCAALVDTISSVIEKRLALPGAATSGWRGSWLVVVVDRPTGVSGLAEALERGTEVGVSALWLSATGSAPSARCVSTLRVADVTGSRIAVQDAGGSGSIAVLDQVSSEWADDAARCLAPLVDGGATGAASVPKSCRLLDVLELPRPTSAQVSGRWARSSGGACSAIGMGAAGAVVTVDLATDGPHALIAGTTGAGKSELLRTIVAGLAVAHSPDELNLLLIDYKGGAAFAECARLPHVAGLVTDLDPYLTERALRSLRAELRRRERLFAAARADDLLDYRQRSPHQPIPRLVIVVDEFATLAEELPDFMSGLVNVARLGRSFGLHLVLATQRPSGAVSPEIRANTDLRIALRLAEPAESRDVIDSPLAASVDRRLPGRAYLRAGSMLTCFQTAYASGHGAPDGPAVRVQLLDQWRRAPEAASVCGEPDLVRLTAAVTAAARERGGAPVQAPWPPPLPDRLARTELDPPSRSTAVPLGRIDRPDEQRQVPFEFDLAATGSLLLAGAARSGRTNALVNLALGVAGTTSPTELHLHVIDGSGELARTVRLLPHCATVLGPAELGLVPALLGRLERVIAQRRVEATAARHQGAALLVLIDGWDAVCAALGGAEVAAGTDALGSLLRAAPSADIALAVAGDRAVLVPRFAAGFGERLALRLPDRQDAGAVGVRAGDVPPDLPAGRAVRARDHSLLQLALAAPSADALRAEIAAIALRWLPAEPGPSAVRVRPLPDRIRLAELPAAPGRLTLGLAGDDPAPVLADPFAGPARWLVAGPPRSGRSTLLRLLADQAWAVGTATLVAAAERSPVLAQARSRGIPTLGPAGAPAPTPTKPTLVLVDDSETFTETAAGAQLAGWAQDRELPIAVVAAGRADDLATSYRGVAAEVRRHRFGVLLRPGPLDGELFGVRLARPAGSGPPGRGVAIADASWGAAFEHGGPVPIQVAMP